MKEEQLRRRAEEYERCMQQRALRESASNAAPMEETSAVGSQVGGWIHEDSGRYYPEILL